ncbi:MAG: hypothetical protein DI586_03955 [Micavibrio aeruginosavorus]|uniref:Lnb N-terminal periplasmic domain-containing protein n=1 Tax=Micavibrio aeruginosavorus TaxID=349221 RepID=A0A2W5FN14_9BACT|nr:MAG: hypothetical protein DI586_03955 [Micavibrio aeruginosavorus]
MRRLQAITNKLQILTTALSGAVVILVSMYFGIAFWYELPVSNSLKFTFCALWFVYVLITLVTLFSRYRRISLTVFTTISIAFVAWWMNIAPSNNRVWADDVAHTVTGRVSGDQITLYNVRNFEWRGLDEYDARWETREYDLSTLNSVDLFLSTWGNLDIAHTLISFGFSNGDYVTFSVEIRKEHDESFSEVAGFFKQYEVALIAADEGDIIHTRTNIRHEDVSRYRVNLTPEQRKSLFLSYMQRGNELAETPSFYNTITANCTTVVFDMIRLIVPSLPLDYRILVSGRLPSYIYDIGGFGHELSLREITNQSSITQRAQASARENFSHEIRAPKAK